MKKGYQEKWFFTSAAFSYYAFMGPICTEGVVLKVLPFKESDKILTLFTPQGILKLYAKGKKRLNLSFQALTSPFTIGEYLYNAGKGDLCKLHDGSLLSQNLHLRESWEAFQSAVTITEAILSTQWPGKPAPRLYALFRFFLERMPLESHHGNILSTFLLKLLTHEGLLQLQNGCSFCESPHGSYRFGGERFCARHAPPNALLFSEREENLLQELAQVDSFTKMFDFQLPSDFQIKVKNLFEQRDLNLK